MPEEIETVEDWLNVFRPATSNDEPETVSVKMSALPDNHQEHRVADSTGTTPVFGICMSTAPEADEEYSSPVGYSRTIKWVVDTKGRCTGEKSKIWGTVVGPYTSARVYFNHHTVESTKDEVPGGQGLMVTSRQRGLKTV